MSAIQPAILDRFEKVLNNFHNVIKDAKARPHDELSTAVKHIEDGVQRMHQLVKDSDLRNSILYICDVCNSPFIQTDSMFDDQILNLPGFIEATPYHTARWDQFTAPLYASDDSQSFENTQQKHPFDHTYLPAGQSTSVTYGQSLTEGAVEPTAFPQQGHKRHSYSNLENDRKRSRNSEQITSLSDHFELRCILISRMTGKSAKQIDTVMEIYLSVIGLEAMNQLKDAIYDFTLSKQPVFPCGGDNVGDITQSLDGLCGTTYPISLLNRILLVRFAKCNDKVLTKVNQASSEESRTLVKILNGRSASRAIDIVTCKTNPRLADASPERFPPNFRQDYQGGRKKVSNRKRDAKHWASAVSREKFGLGFLAIIPVGGLFKMSNSKFGTLYDDSCDVLLDLLEETHGATIEQISSQLQPLMELLCNGEIHGSNINLDSIEGFSSDDSSLAWVEGVCKAVADKKSD